MIYTKSTFQHLNKVTGIELEQNENGMVNMAKFIDDYKNKYPQEFKQRFCDASPHEVMALFLSGGY